MSRPSEPEGTDAMSSWRDSPSLSRMMAPLPYSFSTLAMASSSAAALFFAVLSSLMRSPYCASVQMARPNFAATRALEAVREGVFQVFSLERRAWAVDRGLPGTRNVLPSLRSPFAHRREPEDASEETDGERESADVFVERHSPIQV